MNWFVWTVLFIGVLGCVSSYDPPAAHQVKGGYPGELVRCTKDYYEA